MKTIPFILMLGMIACSGKKILAVEESIKARESSKGYSMKDYHILTEREVNDLLIVRFSATVVSPVTFQEIVDIDNVKLRKMGDDMYVTID
jgi:hypothetical protein